MTMSVEKFREQAARLRAPGHRGMPRYPDVLRRFAVTYALSAGVGVGKAADRLGVSDVTLRVWMRDAKRTGALLPVIVTSDEPERQRRGRVASNQPAILTLRTVHGHELGPLDPGDRCGVAASVVMIGSTRAVRVYAYSEPVDMRKSYDGLEGIVRNELGHDLLRGDLYLFTGKDRRRAKVLLFDGTGMCIYMKRMSRGQFAKLRDVDGELRMTMSELALYLEGSELVSRETLSPPALRLKDLARFDRP
jgi:transposase